MKNTGLKLKDLPKRHKGLLIGLILSTGALFLPWYSDVDSYGSGISYLAVSGPASLIGISVLIFNLFGLSALLYSILLKKDFTSNRRLIENLLGPVYLYAGAILLSIYFHPDFGLNVTQKSLYFGAYFGLLGGFITSYSAFVFKKEELSHDNPHTIEDVIRKEDPELKQNWEEQKNLEQRIMERSSQRLEEHNGKEDFVSPKEMDPNNAFGNARRNGYETAEEIINKQQNRGSYMYRNDL